MGQQEPITVLLQRVSRGENAAQDELFDAVYDELRRLAGWFIRRDRPGHTLQPTALVNEAYLRMLGHFEQDWTNRAHFFAVASKVMRRILVDSARKHNAAKRDADAMSVMEEPAGFTEDRLGAVLAVDAVLAKLQQLDERQAKIVEMRFFGGLTEEEIALVLGTSDRTVKRDWKTAKAWLRAEFAAESARAAHGS